MKYMAKLVYKHALETQERDKQTKKQTMETHKQISKLAKNMQKMRQVSKKASKNVRQKVSKLKKIVEINLNRNRILVRDYSQLAVHC